MNLKRAYVYILSNKNRTVFYIGITNEVAKHKSSTNKGFTKKYNVIELVCYEIHNEITQAIAREKQLKEWKRSWKIDLIKTMNSEMINLAEDWEYEQGEYV